MNRVCKEFKCLPSQAVIELRRHYELVLDVLAVRDYRAVLEAFDRVEADESGQAEMPDHPYVDLIWQVEEEMAEVHLQERDH